MRQREKINYSHCRQFSTFRAGKYNYTQFTTDGEYLTSTNITKDINDLAQNYNSLVVLENSKSRQTWI